MIYTVIAFDDQDGEVIAKQVEAEGPHEAMARYAARTVDHNSKEDILCAIAGEVAITCACEDSGHSASVIDLASNADECQCSDEECTEMVSRDDPYFATPCGTFCDEHMAEHVKACGICKSEFFDEFYGGEPVNMKAQITWTKQRTTKIFKLAGLNCETSRQEVLAVLSEMDGDTVEVTVRRMPISAADAANNFKPITEVE